jgi:hypothetical protein
MASMAQLNKAVRLAQLYQGSLTTTHIHFQQKLYNQMNRAIERIANDNEMSFTDCARQINDEALRRGPITPQPGKDI